MRRLISHHIIMGCLWIDFLLRLRSNPMYLVSWRIATNVVQMYAYLQALRSDYPSYWMMFALAMNFSLIANQWHRISYLDHVFVLKTAISLLWYSLGAPDRFHRLDIGMGFITIVNGLIGKSPLAAPPGLVTLAEMEPIIWLMEIGANITRLIYCVLSCDEISIGIALLLFVLSFDAVSVEVKKICILIGHGFKEPPKRVRTLQPMKRQKRTMGIFS